MRIPSHSMTVAVVLVMAFAGEAHADVVQNCQQTIVGASAKSVQAVFKLRSRSIEGTTRGKGGGGGTLGGHVDEDNDDVKGRIDASCNGRTRRKLEMEQIVTCGPSLAGIGWPSECPNFEDGSCNNGLTNCDDITDCFICIRDAASSQLLALYADEFNENEFGSGSSVNKCQIELTKNTAKLVVAKSKALRKCETDRLRGKIELCPDSESAVPAIAKAEFKYAEKVCKVCGGPDQQCGGPDDLTQAAIGFAGTCPAVTVPHGGLSCGGPVTTLSSLVACIQCVTEFKVACLDLLTVPSLESYPPECNTAIAP